MDTIDTGILPPPPRAGNAFLPVLPECALHRVRLVYRLPRRCPFATPDYMDALHRLERDAWQAAGSGRYAPLAEIASVCGDCVHRLGGHPHIERLRRGVTR